MTLFKGWYFFEKKKKIIIYIIRSILLIIAIFIKLEIYIHDFFFSLAFYKLSLVKLIKEKAKFK